MASRVHTGTDVDRNQALFFEFMERSAIVDGFDVETEPWDNPDSSDPYNFVVAHSELAEVLSERERNADIRGL